MSDLPPPNHDDQKQEPKARITFVGHESDLDAINELPTTGHAGVARRYLLSPVSGAIQDWLNAELNTAKAHPADVLCALVKICADTEASLISALVSQRGVTAEKSLEIAESLVKTNDKIRAHHLELSLKGHIEARAR